MKSLNVGFAIPVLSVLLMGSAAMAQDTAKAVVTEMKARSDADLPTVAECDFLCKFGKETWTIHTRSFCGIRPNASARSRIVAYGLKTETMDGLDFLFPSGAFTAIASVLDPITIQFGMQGVPMRLLPPVNVDGETCQVLVLDGLPRQAHVGGVYPVPTVNRATVSLFIREGRIKRIVAEITRKSRSGRPEPPLTLEAVPRYRRPKTSAARPPSAPPSAQFRPEGIHSWVSDIAWSPDSSTLACIAQTGGCTMISVSGGVSLGTIPTLAGMRSVRFTADGKYLLVPDERNGRFLYLDASTGKEAKSVPTGAGNLVIISSDQSKALVWDRSDSRNIPRVLECSTGRTLYEMPAAKSGDIEFNSTGTRFAVLTDDRVDIKDAATGRDLQSFTSRNRQDEEFPSNRFVKMAFSPDSRMLAIADSLSGNQSDRLLGEETPEPGRVYVYEIETGRLVRTLTGMIGSVTALQFSPDGRLLAVGDSDNRGEVEGNNAAVMVWETRGWKSLGAIAVQPQTAITRLQFSPDGKSLATVSALSASVEIWPAPRL